MKSRGVINSAILFSRPIIHGGATESRVLALLILLLQLGAAVTAFKTHLMLYADGAYFVYAVSSGEAWTLKWWDIATRSTVFLTTVLPTICLTDIFDLTPIQVTQVNGFIFYFVQFLQYLIAFIIVWKENPEYIIFPSIQYVLSGGIGFGFPSEIFIAPGFLWIALFLILRGLTVSVYFIICFVALVFCHELAMPAALILGYAAWRCVSPHDIELRQIWRRGYVTLVVLGSVAALWMVRISGGAGTDHTAIYVFYPSRILNNPTLWLMSIMALGLFFCLRRGIKINIYATVIAFFIALLVPVVLRSAIDGLDFSQGRYDSARTLTAASMAILLLIFLMLTVEKKENYIPINSSKINTIPIAVFCACAITAGSAIAFLLDWSVAMSGFRRVVLSPRIAQTEFIPWSQAKALMLPKEALIANRMGFHWVLPYRSIAIANGGVPSHIIFSDFDSYSDYCQKSSRLSFDNSHIPRSVLAEMQHFACTHNPPPGELGRVGRFLKYLSNLPRMLFGGE